MMMPYRFAPPRLARRLLSLLLGAADTELARELAEDYQARVATRGRLVAGAWYWRQVLHLDTWRLRRELRLRAERSRATSPRPLGTSSSVFYDLRFAWRSLRRQPGFAFTVIATLALGIGGNTAIFSVVHGVLLKPLPYPQPEQLVYVWVQTDDNPRMLFSGPGSADFAEQAVGFSGVTRIFGGGRSPVDFGDGTEEAIAQGVAYNAFSVYGLTPVAGRNLEPGDVHLLTVAEIRDSDLIRPTAPVVLSHEYWMRRFGGDSTVIGRVIKRSGHNAVIVGVQPPGFVMQLPASLGGAMPADMWFIPYWNQSLFPRDGDFVRVIGRLAPGVTMAQAQANVDEFARRQRELHPEQRNRNYRLRVVPLHDGVVTDAAQPVLVLFGAVGFVLLIACANVANLSLAQAMSREREWVVRASVGAGWWRLVRQSLTESAVLAALGTGVGLAIAWWGVPALLALSPASLPRASEIGVDTTIFWFTVATAVLATLLFGLAPALRTARTEPAEALKSRGGVTRRNQRRFRSALVVGEVALALVLVVGTGLLLRSFVGLVRVDPGFDPEGIITATVTPTSQHYPTPENRVAFFRRLQESFSAIPGVSEVGIAQPLPFQGIQTTDVGVRRDDGTVVEVPAGLRQWFPGTFEALRMRLVAGRFLAWSDFSDINRFTVVVDERFAQSAWPDAQPLGKQVRVVRREYGGDSDVWLEPYWAEVVGVVQPIRGRSLERDDPPSVFVSFHQNPWAGGEFAVRAQGDPAATVTSMRAALREVTTAYPLSDVAMLADQVAGSLAGLRFSLSLIGLFGGVSLVMAFVGIYGVIAYDVRQRAGEIGMRMALGAEARDIFRLVVGDGMRMMALGLLVGTGAAMALTRVLASQLFGVEATDPLTFVVVMVLLLGTGVVACYMPARRASALDPVETLKAE